MTGLTLFDARTGRLRPLVPADPARVRVDAREEAAPGSVAQARARRLEELLSSALPAWGLAVERRAADADVVVASAAPPGPALWLKPGAGGAGPLAEALGRGFSGEDARFWALRLHYRAETPAGWASWEAAREERSRLEQAERALASRASADAPNEAALSGYLRRLRQSLGRDLDAGAALDCLWDALRPGALSPPTAQAALRQARAWLGF